MKSKEQFEAFLKTYKENKSTKNKTSESDIKELQERLVKCCIDFIKEKNLGDLETVSFRADMLQESSKGGMWLPCTDSSIFGYEYTYYDNGLPIESVLASYC
jgi:hypothetical protein